MYFNSFTFLYLDRLKDKCAMFEHVLTEFAITFINWLLNCEKKNKNCKTRKWY